jgi:hypothetical protein
MQPVLVQDTFLDSETWVAGDSNQGMVIRHCELPLQSLSFSKMLMAMKQSAS